MKKTINKIAIMFLFLLIITTTTTLADSNDTIRINSTIKEKIEFKTYNVDMAPDIKIEVITIKSAQPVKVILNGSSDTVYIDTEKFNTFNQIMNDFAAGNYTLTIISSTDEPTDVEITTKYINSFVDGNTIYMGSSFTSEMSDVMHSGGNFYHIAPSIPGLYKLSITAYNEKISMTLSEKGGKVLFTNDILPNTNTMEYYFEVSDVSKVYELFIGKDSPKHCVYTFKLEGI